MKRVGGSVDCSSTMENHMGVPKEIKNKVAI
jgi:hypothetical protein